VPFSRALQRIFKYMGRRQGKCNEITPSSDTGVIPTLPDFVHMVFQ